MLYDTLIEETAAALSNGKTILYPTDTIWGLGCDACNQDAVAQIYKIKERSREKPFIILVDSIKMLKDYVEDIHPRVETLLVYHQRPLTLIFKKAKNLPEISISADKSVGIRIAQDPFCQSIISKLGRPIISSSANKSNQQSPSFYREISFEIKEEVDYIVDHRQDDEVLRESSVIATFDNSGELLILRN